MFLCVLEQFKSYAMLVLRNYLDDTSSTYRLRFMHTREFAAVIEA
jgi:hypothetical protein